MRQNLITASLAMAYMMGIRQHAYDLQEKANLTTQQMLNAQQPYIMIGCDMIEAATGLTMANPENVVQTVFISFGKWLGETTKKLAKLPDQETALAALADRICLAFDGSVSRDQKDRLVSMLKEMQKEHLDE
jgi:hypothetical protein